MTQDQSRLPHFLDHIGDSESLSGPCHSQQGLERHTTLYTVGQGRNRFRLISCRTEWGR